MQFADPVQACVNIAGQSFHPTCFFVTVPAYYSRYIREPGSCNVCFASRALVWEDGEIFRLGTMLFIVSRAAKPCRLLTSSRADAQHLRNVAALVVLTVPCGTSGGRILSCPRI